MGNPRRHRLGAAILALALAGCAVDRSGIRGAVDAAPIPDGCAPAAETCNLADDDCDGAVDEGVTRACGIDVGACAPGVEMCVDGAFGRCEGSISPAAEACDGALDEDCDGATDEGCGCTDGQTRPCGDDIGRCQAGVETCAGGAFGGCTAIGPRDEICDGVDDDCDGSIDETPAIASTPTCPAPCTWGERGGHAYLFCRGAWSWAAGRAHCQSLGYDYAVIEDATEQAFVWASAQATGPPQDWWIGLSDQAAEGTFVWTDGTPLGGFQPWNPGQPDDGGSPALEEDCAELNEVTGGAWNDLDCALDYLSIVCEAG